MVERNCMDTITITKAQKSDIDVLMKWGNETPEIWLNDEFRWYPETSMVESLISSHRAVFLVARINGKPVGMCLVHNLIVWGYCDTLFVAKEYRGRGIATKLVTEAERQLKKVGVKLMALHMITTNKAATEVYRKMGFIPGVKVQFYEKTI
jgi:ribosomal protein S18 acetylase RimI-like enzyme